MIVPLFSRRATRVATMRLSILAAISLCSANLRAQTMQPTGLTNPADGPSPSPTNDLVQPGPPVSESVRRLHYTLSLDVSEIYDDNITLAPTGEIDDYYTRISPAISVGFGDTLGRQENFLELNYQPNILFFADNTNFNTVEHIGHIAAQYRFSRLAVGASQDVQIVETGGPQLSTLSGTFVNGVNIDTGGRRKINTYTTHVNASYDLSAKTYVTLAGDYSLVDYPGGFTDSQRLTGNFFFNYIYSDKLNFGIGGSAGKDLLAQGSGNESFEQANVRASYVLTGKLTANGSGGVEIRQARGGNDSVAPVFDLAIDYAPSDGASLSLQANRKTLNSAGFAGQDYASTQFQITAQQRFFQRVFLAGSGGYQNLDYFNVPVGTPSREDNYYFVQPAIDVRITNFWYAGAFFGYRNNESNFFTFGFEDKHAGVHTTLKF